MDTKKNDDERSEDDESTKKREFRVKLDDFLNSAPHEDMFTSDEFILEVEELINEELTSLVSDEESGKQVPDDQYYNEIRGNISYHGDTGHMETVVEASTSASSYDNEQQLSHVNAHYNPNEVILTSDDHTVNIEDSEDSSSIVSLRKRLRSMRPIQVDQSLNGLEALKRLPQYISICVNSGDLLSLHSLIDDHFDIDCGFRSRVIDNLIGRKYTYLLFEALMQAVPDYIFVTKKSKIVRNKLINQVYFTGTRTFTAKNQYLFQNGNCYMTDVIAQSRTITIEERYDMKQRENMLRESNERVSVWGGGQMILTFDIDTFKVIHFHCDWGLRAFKESTF